MMVKELEEVVVRFSGDSGDGMQLAGNIFSNVSATVGNDICTFPDYPADIRAPQGSLTGVSGFQVHVGASKIFTPGDHCHVLVAMNPAALKTQIKFCKPQGLVLTDSDSFGEKDLEKAQFKTGNPFEELGIKQQVLEVPFFFLCFFCFFVCFFFFFFYFIFFLLLCFLVFSLCRQPGDYLSRTFYRNLPLPTSKC